MAKKKTLITLKRSDLDLALSCPVEKLEANLSIDY